MLELADTTSHPDYSVRGKVLRGKIQRAPKDLYDTLTVSLINYTESYTFDVAPGHWSSRGVALPPAGAQAVVLFDDHGDAWMPTWEGVTSLAPVSTGIDGGHSVSTYVASIDGGTAGSILTDGVDGGGAVDNQPGPVYVAPVVTPPYVPPPPPPLPPPPVGIYLAGGLASISVVADPGGLTLSTGSGGTAVERSKFEPTASFCSAGPGTSYTGPYPLSDTAAWAQVKTVAEGTTTAASNRTPSGTPILRGSPGGTVSAGNLSELQNAAGVGPNGWYPTNSQLDTYLAGVNNMHVVNSLFYPTQYLQKVTGQPFGPPNPAARGGVGVNFTDDAIPSTDMLIQWAWTKWGLPPRMGRAQCAWESAWLQTALGDWGNSGSGAYDSLSWTNAPTYSKASVSPGRCRSISIVQWSGAYSGVYGGHALPMSATDPMRYLGTAFALDFLAATLRLAYDNPLGIGQATGGWALSACGNNTGGQGYITGESQGNIGGDLDHATTAQLLPMGGFWYTGGYAGYNNAAALSYNASVRGRAQAVGSPSFGTGASDLWLAY